MLLGGPPPITKSLGLASKELLLAVQSFTLAIHSSLAALQRSPELALAETSPSATKPNLASHHRGWPIPKPKADEAQPCPATDFKHVLAIPSEDGAKRPGGI